jgi:hypothetical protein
MSTLSRFSEKERDYHRYQSRQEALRVQRSIQRALDEARAATEAARADEQAARAAMEAERQAKEAARAGEQAAREAEQAALAEVARLKALLQQQTDR